MAYTIDVEPATYINLDLFPAAIQAVTADFEPKHEEYRVIVTDNYLYIIDDTLEGPAAIFKSPLVDFAGDTKTGYTVDTEDGSFAVQRALNCGCGSRIRGIHPFPGVPHKARLKR